MTSHVRSGSEFIVDATRRGSPIQAYGAILADDNFVTTGTDADFKSNPYLIASPAFAALADLNEAPEITSGSTFAVSENGLVAGTITAVDSEGDAITYTIVSGAEALTYSIAAYYDSGKFYLNPTTGVLTFNTAPNYEAPADYGSDNVYNLLVRATDANGAASAIQAITITIGNINEGTVIASNGGGATAAFSVSENQVFATTVIARDNVGPSVTYSISGGYDAAKFAIDATTGVLTFITAPNYEAPNDFGANRVYDVIVKASDGLLADTQALAISITNVNEAPVITSNGGGATAAISVNENVVSSVTTVFATDPENTARTYSIIGGADAARFSINATSGGLSFVGSPNFEAPTDAGADNVYDVIVQVSDGSLADTQAIAITVLNVNEAPVITSAAAFSVQENMTAVTTITSTDQENQTRTYSISGGLDAARFTIDAASGALSFVAAPNYEAPNDSGANRIYNIVVAASDGTSSATKNLAITVTNVDEAPIITSNGGGATASIAVNENSTAVTTVISTDPENAARAYAIAGGADAASFVINATTGALSFLAAPDFEAPGDTDGDNAYDVIVQASDGALTDTQAITVMVADVNEPTAFSGQEGMITQANKRQDNAGGNGITVPNAISRSDMRGGQAILANDMGWSYADLLDRSILATRPDRVAAQGTASPSTPVAAAIAAAAMLAESYARFDISSPGILADRDNGTSRISVADVFAPNEAGVASRYASL
ncbi:MAG: hypothetical protein V4564_00705 [Pseudomonadota bacterium]